MSGTGMLVYAFIKTTMLGINYELTDLLLTKTVYIKTCLFLNI